MVAALVGEHDAYVEVEEATTLGDRVPCTDPEWTACATAGSRRSGDATADVVECLSA